MGIISFCFFKYFTHRLVMTLDYFQKCTFTFIKLNIFYNIVMLFTVKP